MMNLGKMMKKAQEMQASMAEMQVELATLELTGEAGGGMVRITMNGKKEVQAVHIDPSLLDDEVSLLEDLLLAAINAAASKAEEEAKSRQQNMMAGLPIPPGFSL